MVKEKLTIKNFGPIKFIELDLGRFNVLIGEQATGKSTVAKLLAVCRYFSYLVWNNGTSVNSFEIGLESWGFREFIQNDTYIFYDCPHYSFTVLGELANTLYEKLEDEETYASNRPMLKIELAPKSEEFKELLRELNKLSGHSGSNSPFGSPALIVPTSFYQNDVANVMDNPFYLPTERGLQSVFSLGKNSIQNISDSLFNQFAQLDQISRLFGETEIEPLDIIYKNVKGQRSVRKKNEDRFYDLVNGASGFQSTIPVILSIRYYNEIRKKSKTFIIEEPEMNLFPIAQHRLMQFVVDQTVNYGNAMLVTTHSPYILTSLNNMIYAYQVGRKRPNEANNIIDKKYWLDPSYVSVYMLRPDGTCENLLDLDTGLIMAEKIDGVSGTLNEQFDALLNIEFEGK